MKEHETEIADVVAFAPFSIIDGQFPATMPELIRSFLSHVSDKLETKRPRGITAAIAVPSPMGWPKTHVDLFVFGSFRSRYGAIKGLAQLLPTLFLQYEILPQIHPFTLDDIQYCTSDPLFMKRIRNNGTVVFHLVPKQ